MIWWSTQLNKNKQTFRPLEIVAVALTEVWAKITKKKFVVTAQVYLGGGGSLAKTSSSSTTRNNLWLLHFPEIGLCPIVFVFRPVKLYCCICSYHNGTKKLDEFQNSFHQRFLRFLRFRGFLNIYISYEIRPPL